MINKRLIGLVPESKKYIFICVLVQWLSLVANAVIMWIIAFLFGNLAAFYLEPESVAADRAFNADTWFVCVTVAIICLILKAVLSVVSGRSSFAASETVKKKLRQQIYDKLLKLGAGYSEKVATSEVVQVSVEGVDQLETYFGAYLPQFFYAMLAPTTLFIVLAFVDIWSAIVLLICVPLIPVTIIVIQKWAKKLLSKYWGQYTALGDTFLENLQGLITAKIYNADEFKHKELNEQSEHFRKITMKVLTMQLNSITIMDLIAYGGAAVGMIVAVCGYSAGRNSFSDTLFIMLLSADFFIPMRVLGSFFHIAMNGMAASDKIFKLMDLPENEIVGTELKKAETVKLDDVHFSYDDREVLHGINMEFKRGKFTAIVGESGCGKSTVAGLVMKHNTGYQGSITVGGEELKNIENASLYRHICYVSHQAYLFAGTLRENLLMGKHDASDEELMRVLREIQMADFVTENGGLDMKINEKGGNLSGGQCQRIAMARALLFDADIYIFDEATSNIDVESENMIMNIILKMAREKTVVLISHRLANVEKADRIYVMGNGVVTEEGTTNELINNGRTFARLWNTQKELCDMEAWA